MGDLSQTKSTQYVSVADEETDFTANVFEDAQGTKRLQTSSRNVLDSSLRIIQYTGAEVEIDGITFYDVYNNTGALTVSGFFIRFDDKKVRVRLEIDGVEVFNIDVERLKEISDLNGAPSPQTYVAWNDGSKVFYFTPSFPMQSNTSVKIQVRAKVGQTKKYRGSIVQVG